MEPLSRTGNARSFDAAAIDEDGVRFNQLTSGRYTVR